MSKPALKLIPILYLPLAACAPPIAETDVRVASAPVIRYAKEDTCDTQKQIEAYHSWRDSMLKKKRVVYVAQCGKV